MAIPKNKFNYKIELKLDGKWTESVKDEGGGRTRLPWARPFSTKDVLDNSLDVGNILYWQVHDKKPIPPFTPVRITIYEFDKNGNRVEENVRYMFTSDASVKQKAFTYNGVSREMFDHQIPLIELTKKLERTGAETLSNTRYLARSFDSGAVPLEANIDRSNANTGTPKIELKSLSNMYSPIMTGEPVMLPTLEWRAPAFLGPTINVTEVTCRVTSPSGKVMLVDLAEEREGTGLFGSGLTVRVDPKTSIILTEVGDYRIRYTFRYMIAPSSQEQTESYYTIAAEYFATAKNFTVPEKLRGSITDAINRVLDVSPVRRDGIDPIQYRLDPSWAERLSTVTAPEFFAPQKNLFETLAIIVGNEHLIPRLAWDTETDTPSIITFDVLGGRSIRHVPERVAAFDANISADDYCGAIDCIGNNVVNTLDEQHGTITEPAVGGYKTLRAPDGEILITNDNAVLNTTAPIYKITKLTIYDPEGDKDLTSFVYEQAEYDALHYQGQWPWSRQYALVFKHGDNKLSGFSTKYVSGEILADAFELPVIQAILQKVKYSLPVTLYKDFRFQIEYVPMSSVRVVQKNHLLEIFQRTTPLFIIKVGLR